MRSILASIVVAGSLTAGLSAQNATLTAIHGIPGLSSSVDVFANNSKLFSFDFGDSKGPLSLKPGTYKLDIKLGNQVVLSASPKLAANTSYTAIAHLKEKTGIQLSFFVNDLSPVAKGKSRLAVRHTAMAPAVDVLVRTTATGPYAALIKNLANPKEAGADVAATKYWVALGAAGTNKVAFGPAQLTLSPDNYYAVYAIGELGKKSFRLVVQNIALPKQPALKGMVRGKSCGGAIAISTKAPMFDTKFMVSLTGATNNGIGILHMGTSDSDFGSNKLPLMLDSLGLKGCRLYQNTEIFYGVMMDSKGMTSSSFLIPSSIAPMFKEFHFQYSFVAPKANALGLALTDYASIERM